MSSFWPASKGGVHSSESAQHIRTRLHNARRFLAASEIGAAEWELDRISDEEFERLGLSRISVMQSDAA